MADARSREGPGEWNACPATLIELDRTPTATVISPAVGYRKWPVRSRRCISFKGRRARATCDLERGSCSRKAALSQARAQSENCGGLARELDPTTCRHRRFSRLTWCLRQGSHNDEKTED